MMRSVLSRYRGRSRGQALVEFTLTALLFLLLLVMIVEVARLLAAYVTIQHAARQAARYAVTGNWEAGYQSGPADHYDSNSSDPFARIAPCWAQFDNDPLVPSTVNEWRGGPTIYQPYRNARTCSVEAAALKAMTGLALDPKADPGEGNYYIIDVQGYATDRYPETGTFERGSYGPADYSSYFPPGGTAPDGYNTPYDGATAGMTPGFAGEPSQKVAVRIRYQLPIITPLVSAIVPSVTLNGAAYMTNEAFGSTSLQREAVEPPDLPALNPLEDRLPPDLTIPSFTTTWDLLNTVTATDDLEFTIDVSNISGWNTNGTYDVTIYETADNVDPASVGPTPPVGWTAVANGQWTALPNLEGGRSVTPPLTVTNAHLSLPGPVYVYAWVDSGEDIDEEGDALADPAREMNNVAKLGPFILGDAVDLSIDAVTLPLNYDMPPNLGTVTYSVDVDNIGPSDAGGVEVHISFPSGLDATPGVVGPCSGTVGGGFDCPLGSMPVGGGGASFTFELNLGPGADDTEFDATFSVTETTGINVINTSDDIETVKVYVNGTELTISKTVDPATPAVGTNVTYTITVTNIGSNAANGVHVTDTLPAPNLTYVSHTAEAGTSYDSGSGDWDIGTLGAGATATLELVALVQPPAASGIVNVAEVATMTNPSPNPNPQSSVSITSEKVNVEIVKEVSDGTENYEGGIITYTLWANNLSTSTEATNLTIEDDLPDGVTYVSHLPDSAAEYLGGVVTWEIGNLQPLGSPGDSQSLVITVQVDAGRDGDTITNEATLISLDQADLDSTDDTGVDSFIVDDRTDLGMSVSTKVNGTTGTTASIGDTVVFTWRITNNGPMDATDLSVSVDDILELTNWTGITVEDESGSTLDLSSSLGDLVAGDYMDIIVTATVANIPADTTDTFAATVSAATPDDLDDSPGGGTDPEDDSVTMTLVSGPQQFVDENFDTDQGCFSTFGAIGSSYPLRHATETYPVTGASGNAMRANLGFGTPDNDTNVAGGWTCTFNVGSAVSGSLLTFSYRIIPNVDYDNGEHTSVVVDVDGSLVLAPQVYWSQDSDTGWQVATVDVGALAAGSHTISIGGYNNQKTQSTENGYVLIDSVNLSEIQVLLNATFDTNANPMTAVPVQAFEGLIGGTPHDSSGNNSTATYAGAQGNPAGSLLVRVGAITSASTNMSAGYEYTFTLTSAADVYLDFDYSFTMPNNYESGEDGYVLVSVDDTTLIGSDLDNSVFHFQSSNVGVSTGWVSSGRMYLGNLSAGTHTIMIGGFNDTATEPGGEITTIYIDNVYMTAE